MDEEVEVERTGLVLPKVIEIVRGRHNHKLCCFISQCKFFPNFSHLGPQFRKRKLQCCLDKINFLIQIADSREVFCWAQEMQRSLQEQKVATAKMPCPLGAAVPGSA